MPLVQIPNGSLCLNRYVESAAAAGSGNDKASLSSQVSLAAMCCQVSEGLLQAGEGLWVVPPALVGQVRRSNEQDRQRRQAKENKPVGSNLKPLCRGAMNYLFCAFSYTLLVSV